VSGRRRIGLAALLATGALLFATTALAALQTRADVDGDGIADTVDLLPPEEGLGPGYLRVTRGSTGEVSEIEYDSSPGGFTASMLIVAELDRVAGAEIVIDAQHITTNEFIEIYTMSGGRLHQAGEFYAYGSDSDHRFGIRCVRSPRFTGVVQYSFSQNARTHRWTRTTQRFKWRAGRLVRDGRATKSKVRGRPKRSQTGVACG
jgi:hypothetical protein